MEAILASCVILEAILLFSGFWSSRDAIRAGDELIDCQKKVIDSLFKVNAKLLDEVDEQSLTIDGLQSVINRAKAEGKL